MYIIKDFITPNEYSRPQTKIKELRAIVIHWTANPCATAKANRDYFESKKTGMGGYGSAQYIIDCDGSILQCMPENEVAYHCGTSAEDPASGKVYTDYARAKFGKYASKTSSPNLCTIGVELCPINWAGQFSDETLESAAELCADIIKRHGLTIADITTHNQIVGWKDCPRLWTTNPEYFESFKRQVKTKLNMEA